MRIIIKFNSGPVQVFGVVVSESDTVARLKEVVEQETGVPASSSQVVWSGEILADDRTILSYDIPDDSVVDMYPSGNAVQIVLPPFADLYKMNRKRFKYGSQPVSEPFPDAWASRQLFSGLTLEQMQNVRFIPEMHMMLRSGIGNHKSNLIALELTNGDVMAAAQLVQMWQSAFAHEPMKLTLGHNPDATPETPR